MSSPAPRLLVSVRDAADAVEALAGGADWIDLKEPRRGALGAVDAATARSVVNLVAGRAPISAAAGELRDWPGAAAELLDVDGVSLFKVGLAGCARNVRWHHGWREVFNQVREAGKQLAAVIYADMAAADAPHGHEVLDAAAELGCPWALWDTFDKSGGALTAQLSPVDLVAQLAAARHSGMKAVLGGQVTIATLPLLPWGAFDMIAVRGAACRGSRDSAVCRERVAELRDALTSMDPLMHSGVKCNRRSPA
jgi:uncharacterized protein (UPF0264 family)